jgi:hypothetical protein
LSIGNYKGSGKDSKNPLRPKRHKRKALCAAKGEFCAYLGSGLTPGVVSGAELEARVLRTVLGAPQWNRRANKNQAISAQPSEERVRTLVELFTFRTDETAQVVKA